MNFVGHIHIAGHHVDQRPEAEYETTELRDRYLFGTALPDFAAIGRFQLRSDPTDRVVGAGVEMHHATDNAFHGSEWFTTHSQAVRSELERRGVNRGAARAVGHVGVELLLDGHLLAVHGDLRNQAQRVIELADNPDLDLARLVPEDQRPQWSVHLRRIASWPLPDDYHRPMAVAERLHRILRPRKRLAFGDADVAVVADTLAEASADLLSGVDDMVESVTADL